MSGDDCASWQHSLALISTQSIHQSVGPSVRPSGIVENLDACVCVCGGLGLGVIGGWTPLSTCPAVTPLLQLITDCKH